MIRGVAVVFGLFMMAIITIFGAWVVITLTQEFVEKYHEFKAYLAARKLKSEKK